MTKKSEEIKKEEPEPKDIFEDFDTELFHKIPKPAVEEPRQEEPEPTEITGMCSYYPKACERVGTSLCSKDCKHNPESFMDPEVKKVYDQEPWSNYCFTCGEFIPSRNHENSLDPPERVYSHTVATGYAEYKAKLSQWTMERLTGKDKPSG